MGRLIPLAGSKLNGQAFSAPRAVYVNDDLISVQAVGSGKTRIIESLPNGNKNTYEVYEKAQQIEALREPLTTNLVNKQQIAVSLGALGANQGAALGLTKYFNEVTTATASSADGVRLPVATAGAVHMVVNNHASVVLDVFPATDGTIDGGAANAAVTLNPGDRKTFVCDVAGAWKTVVDYGK
jgi:hypothetical protein